MEIVVASLAFVAAAACAGTLGFAIQRGGTCAVAAIDELVSHGRATRLAALVEASVWVAGGLLVAQALQLLPALPAGYAATGWTLLGGALLGLGAWVNGACVFGAIARFGSGQWAYLVTPLGFYLGCLSVGEVFDVSAPAASPARAPLPGAPLWAAVAFLAFAVWRLARPLHAEHRRRSASAAAPPPLRHAIARHVWSPHAATTVIGIAYVVLVVLVGAWAYTDVLADAARGMAGGLVPRLLLLAAVLAGAVAGGLSAGGFTPSPVTAPLLARCLAGGMLMGSGSLLVPGGNDGLVLLGMPLLRPYAWLAFAALSATVAALLLPARWRARHTMR